MGLNSVPWETRLASVLFNVRFAADPATFGNLAYGVFHILGVEGLPRTPVVPTTVREIDRLPNDYGLEWRARNKMFLALRDNLEG